MASATRLTLRSFPPRGVLEQLEAGSWRVLIFWATFIFGQDTPAEEAVDGVPGMDDGLDYGGGMHYDDPAPYTGDRLNPGLRRLCDCDVTVMRCS